MKFTHIEQKEADETDEQEHAGQDIKAVFTIIQRPSFLLKGGEALITFEEENGKAQNSILFIEKT